MDTFRVSFRVFSLVALIAPFAAGAATERNRDWMSSLEPTVGYGALRIKNSAASVPSYGFILAIRYHLMSAELELLQGIETRVSSGINSRTEESFSRGRFGLRASFGILSFLETFVRIGIEGQRVTRTTTTSGVETSDPAAMYGYPYIGTGISVVFNERAALNITGSATLKDAVELKRNDYTATVGIQISQKLK